MTKSEILETWVDMGANHKELISPPMGCCVYAIVAMSSLLDVELPCVVYVGATQNIINRFKCHTVIMDAPKWKTYSDFRYYAISVNDNLLFEREMILSIKPPLNNIKSNQVNVISSMSTTDKQAIKRLRSAQRVKPKELATTSYEFPNGQK